ncbi:MAG: hypothetical protein OEX00_09140, partial [Gammaproteobacteria bacterium]|nr:hypothetical protein [Gammaproteobacteria bacterium]
MPDYKDLQSKHDPNDPDPWFATLVDLSIPIDPAVKRAWLIDTSRKSRQYLLPVARPFFRLAIGVIQVLKIITPKRWHAVESLHRAIVFGMTRFVSPEGNWLIMRHFHLGAEIQQFLRINLKLKDMPELNFMRFERIEELGVDAFVKHDMNLFNFVIYLNQELRREGRKIEPPETFDYSMITDGDFPIKDIPTGKWNVIDLLTAIEA